MTSRALTRLITERKGWRQNHPFGFVAKPKKNIDGTLDFMVWTCSIPGMENTPWAGGSYRLKVTFSEDYPTSPPICKFTPPLFHPNVSRNGTVCIPILDESKDWRSEFSIEVILIEIQNVLYTPDYTSPTNTHAYNMWSLDNDGYCIYIREQAKRMARRD